MQNWFATSKKKLKTKSTPKSLAILFLFWVWKTPDFVEAFNHSTFLVGNFPAKKLQVVTVKRPKTLVDFRMNYFLQESLNYPFLGESNNTKVYGNFEDFPSNNALGWVGKSTRILCCKWKMTSWEKARIFQVPIFHRNMIVGGGVISTVFFVWLNTGS